MRTVLWLAAGVLLVVGGRACLPVAIEKGIELGGEQIVDADVEVENVDLGVLEGRLAIEGVRLESRPDRSPASLLVVSRVEVDAAPLAIFSGRIHVENVAVQDGALSLEVSEDGRLRLPLRVELHWPEWIPKLQVDTVSIANVRLAVDDPFDAAPALALDCDAIEVSDLHGQERSIGIGDVRVSGPKLSIDREVALGERGAVGWVDLSERPVAESPEAEPLPAVAAAPDEIALDEPPFQITLQHLRVEDAALHWRDRTFEPPLEERDEGLRLEAHDVVVHEQRLSELQIDGQALRGEPFSIALRSEDGAWLADVTASRVQLATFDPYSRQLASFGLTRGEVSVTSHLRLREGTLDSENELLLHDVRLEGAASLQSFLGVNANLALALLEDDAGDVALAVPVELQEGDDFESAVREAAKGAVLAALEGSLSGLAGAFGPGGYTMPPIPSEPGAAELDPDGEARLASLGALLRRRPEVVAVLTGASAAADRAALALRQRRDPASIRDPELHELARSRAEAARRALVEDHGVPEGRVRVRDAVGVEAPGVRIDLASARD